MKQRLHKGMTVVEFENGYWYLTELKSFLKELGIRNCASLRKDEIEKIITNYIRNKSIPIISSSNCFDNTEDTLELDGLITNYKNNKATKAFIIAEATKINPQLKIKSGSSYWLNRFRESKAEQGERIRYIDLVAEFVRLNAGTERLPQIPSTKMNNFISDFLANESGATRADAMREWQALKERNIPKDYKSWSKHKKQ